MKLYQLDQNKIIEYKITRSHSETTDYKKKIIKSSEPMFYSISTTDEELAQKIKRGENIDSGYYEEPTNNKNFMINPLYHMNKQREKVLTDYIHDWHRITNCVKVENERPKQFQRDYFLLTEEVIRVNPFYTFENAWKMPIELAGITLLDHKKYIRFLEDESLLENFPSELYQAYPINEYDSSLLSAEIPGMEKINRQIEAEGKIINKIKTK